VLESPPICVVVPDSDDITYLYIPPNKNQAAANKLKAELETYGCPPVFPSAAVRKRETAAPSALCDACLPLNQAYIRACGGGLL